MNPPSLHRAVPVAALTAAVLAALPGTAAAACANADAVPQRGAIAAAQAATLCLVNEQRSSRGLEPLGAERTLRRAATRHARNMVRHGFFDHVSTVDGSTVEARVRAAGYLRGARSWRIAENIAWGSGTLATPAATVQGWMDSPGHRANILTADFRELGIGIAAGAPEQVSGAAATYATNFGVRR